MTVSLEQLRPPSKPCVRYLDNMDASDRDNCAVVHYKNDNGNEVPNTCTVLLREVRKGN